MGRPETRGRPRRARPGPSRFPPPAMRPFDTPGPPPPSGGHGERPGRGEEQDVRERDPPQRAPRRTSPTPAGSAPEALRTRWAAWPAGRAGPTPRRTPPRRRTLAKTMAGRPTNERALRRRATAITSATRTAAPRREPTVFVRMSRMLAVRVVEKSWVASDQRAHPCAGQHRVPAARRVSVRPGPVIIQTSPHPANSTTLRAPSMTSRGDREGSNMRPRPCSPGPPGRKEESVAMSRTTKYAARVSGRLRSSWPARSVGSFLAWRGFRKPRRRLRDRSNVPRERVRCGPAYSERRLTSGSTRAAVRAGASRTPISRDLSVLLSLVATPTVCFLMRMGAGPGARPGWRS